MGVCGSKLSEEEKRSRALNQQIDRQNKNDADTESKKVKLLLLGAGESGKSTLFKQMKILYGVTNGSGFTDTERANMKPVVHTNIITNMKNLLLECDTHTPVTDANKDVTKEICTYQGTQVVDEAIAGKLSQAWADDGVKKTWANRGDIQVQDALEYYMMAENISRISKDGYVPTDQDILRSRVRTSGIVEEEFVMQNITFVMFDVGGQRNERKKWIHAFESVHAVIFVAAISEYNQVLYEDNKQNRQKEAVELFGEMCKLEWFAKSGMILFLNKKDLFYEKLKTIPFKVTEGKDIRNTDYDGPVWDPANPGSDDDFENVVEQTQHYLQRLYEKQAEPKEIYPHITCATDTENVRHIMTACKDIILKHNLADNGFM